MDLEKLPVLMPLNIKHLAGEVKGFVGKILWMQKQQREWNCSASMRSQPQKCHRRGRS